MLQIKINLPQILTWPIRLHNVSPLYQSKVVGSMKTGLWAKEAAEISIFVILKMEWWEFFSH